MVALIILCLGVEFLCCRHLMYMFVYVFIILTEWPPVGKIATHSAYDMVS